MRSGVKTPVNIPESLCVWVCPMFEKTISKYVKVNHGGIHTLKKILRGWGETIEESILRKVFLINGEIQGERAYILKKKN